VVVEIEYLRLKVDVGQITVNKIKQLNRDFLNYGLFLLVIFSKAFVLLKEMVLINIKGMKSIN
jgi:hypothetical protein